MEPCSRLPWRPFVPENEIAESPVQPAVQVEVTLWKFDDLYVHAPAPSQFVRLVAEFPDMSASEHAVAAVAAQDSSTGGLAAGFAAV